MELPAGICVSVSEVKASYCMGWVNLVGMLRPTSRDLRQGSPKHARTTSSCLLRLPIRYACGGIFDTKWPASRRLRS